VLVAVLHTTPQRTCMASRHSRRAERLSCACFSCCTLALRYSR
jgi:hypothetical protein